MNYTTLQALIADYLHRTDLTDKIPTFISLAESSLFREIDVDALELSVTGVTVGAYATLPTDFSSLSKLTVSYGGREITLDHQAGTDDEVSIIPSGYSLETDKLRLWGAGDGQAYTLYYKAKLVPLSDLAPSNWLLANAADLYLYTSCLEGAKYLKDQGEMSTLAQMIGGQMASVKSKMERRSLPSSSTLRIKPRR